MAIAKSRWKNVSAHKPEVTLIAGSFTTDGSGDLVAYTLGAGQFTVARTNTGEYTLTFDEPYRVIGPVIGQVLGAAADTFVHPGTVSVSAKTAILRTITAGSAANIASKTIQFFAYMEK